MTAKRRPLEEAMKDQMAEKEAFIAGQEPARHRESRKEKMTFNLPKDLLEECRDAVVTLSGPPVRLTLAGLCEDALRRELTRLQKKHNGGKAFPKRTEQLSAGRPIR